LNCTDCDKEITTYESYKGRCGKCHSEFLEAGVKGLTVEQFREEKAGREKEVDGRVKNISKPNWTTLNKQQSIQRMILTTETSHNLPVDQRLGIISAEIVVGINVFKDFAIGFRNVVGGRGGTLQKALRDIRIQVLEELKNEAALLGADAVVGIDLDYNEIGATGSTMLMLVANGTAVTLKNEQPD